MVREVQFTTIQRVLEDLTDHPLLRDVTLEQCIRHAARFISKHGYSKFFEDRIDLVEIKDFRGTLPCEVISIIQVRDTATGICLRSMTDSFTPGKLKHPDMPTRDALNNTRRHKDVRDFYIPPLKEYMEEPAFKTQGRVIFTSFPSGIVEVAYKAMPIDENGFPMIIDNEVYLDALEAYIKKNVFTVKFDTGKINLNVLQNAKQEYSLAAAQLMSEFTTPSVSEMETITRIINTLIPKIRHFDNGFRDLSSREYIRRH